MCFWPPSPSNQITNADMNHELIRRDEFERVAMPHTESLFRAALRITRERAGAEDIVQETLLRAWNAFDQFERGTNCKAWLFRILLNLSSKQRKKIQAAPAMLALDENDSDRVIRLRVAPPQFAEVEILSALDRLSTEHRTILILAVVEGFTCKEIARMCALPIGTVMSRLSRARSELRKILVFSQQEERSVATAS
jgi:RNA polymerase sigma-70 factor, ECF subfamily